MKSIKYFLVILLFNSCTAPQSDLNYTSFENKIRVEVSEYPIWISNTCESKKIGLWGQNIDINQIQLESGNKILPIELDSVLQYAPTTTSNVFFATTNISLGETNQPLIIRNKIDSTILMKIPVQVKNIGDTITYAKVSYGEVAKTIAFFERKLWFPYSKRDSFSNIWFDVKFDQSLQDKVEGDSIVRNMNFKNISYKNKENNKITKLPDLSFEKKIKYYKWFHLEGYDSQTRLHTIRSEQKVSMLPGYFLLGSTYGFEIKGIVCGCSQIDTLYNQPIELPNHLQVELPKVIYKD